MCLDIADVSQDCTPVSGGLVDSIYLSYKKDVNNIPARSAPTGPITADITMKDGKFFRKFEFLPDTASWDQDTPGDAGYRKPKAVVVCGFKGTKASVVSMLNGLINGQFVLIFIDGQDSDSPQKWVLGTTTRGASFTYKLTTGKKGDDKAEVTLTWELTDGRGAVPYTGVIPTEPEA